MTDHDSEVKYIPPDEQGGPLLVIWHKCVDFMDANPRVGWWVALWGSANLLVNLLDLLG